MPFCVGRSETWPAVCAHWMGKPFSTITAELLRDTAHARRKPRTFRRSMTEELGLQSQMESRACTLDWELSHRYNAYVLSVQMFWPVQANSHTHIDTLVIVLVTYSSVDPHWPRDKIMCGLRAQSYLNALEEKVSLSCTMALKGLGTGQNFFSGNS